jgi:DNA repair protein RecN (Recombination protein N)
MLIELCIRDFAIIERLNISFGPGLNIFTGETGAGKTIIMDAIALMLGDRASSEIIRTGSDEAEVQALFDCSGSKAVKDALSSAGIDAGAELAIRRIVSRTGKNRVYINGVISTLSTLSGLGGLLMDICSQREHESLARPEEHIRLLDSFGGYQGLKLKMRDAFKAYIEQERALKGLLEAREEMKEKAELFQLRLKEIREANLRPGEDDGLSRERDLLRSSGRLKEILLNAETGLYSEEGSVAERVGSVVRSLKEVSSLDDSIARCVEALEGALYSIEDASISLKRRGEAIEEDFGRLEQVEERITEIARLKKLYGPSIDDIIKKGEEAEEGLSGIDGIDERIEAQSREAEGLRLCAEAVSKELTKKRVEAGRALKRLIEAELNGLGIKGAVFDARIQGQGPLTEDGSDSVAFHISTNPGEATKPLNEIASGGEMSRIMLAIKGLSAGGRVPTFVFDEIDAGVGGATAEFVGLKLKEASRAHQVICITHLPQIAAFADRHFGVEKETTGKGRTITVVKELGQEERVQRISMMIAGTRVTDAVRRGAMELIENANALSHKRKRVNG